MSYTKLKSHPHKFLEDHLKSVADFSKSSINSLIFENRELFSEISYLIGLSHDFAKSTSFFQNYLLSQIKNENTPHSFLSAIFSFFTVDNYLKNNNIDFQYDLALISYIVVLYHHGNLKDISELLEYHENKINSKLVKVQVNDLINSKINLSRFYSYENIDYFEFLNNFDVICDEITDRLFDFEYGSNFDNYFNILLLYSVLLDADKMDASDSKLIYRSDIPPFVVDDYKNKNFSNFEGINAIREKAYIEVNSHIDKLDLSEKIYSINLPTGMGKTLTGLSFILKLSKRIYNELDIKPRIIYSLPFLSVIDQNEKVIKDIFNQNGLIGSNILLKHNYLADMKYLNNDNFEVYDISNSKILIEGWNSEFIITTFIQFFYSIIGNKNSFLRKFHNIANSIILLDEIQSIPYKYWGIINLFLKKLAEEFNCWIILMTATQPFIFNENEIISLVDDVEYYFNQFDRVNYNFNLEKMDLSTFSNNLIELIKNNNHDDIMVVLNTVDSSKDIYKNIKEFFEENSEDISVDENGICNVGENINLIYLSTNIIPYHRLNKINFIKNSDKQNIIVTTQLIEAGVDIDVDIVYRDFAPLDSIIQTAGRCNRGGSKNFGQVNVINLVNANGKSFSEFVYQPLLLTTTQEVIGDIDCISEKEFNLSASVNYFSLISKRSFGDEELIKILNNLKFDNIPAKFKLIENLPNKIDIFVCINQEAEEIFERYTFIVESLSGFDKKNEFLKIKNKFYQYVISVDEKKFGSANIFNDEIGVIYKHDLTRKYDFDMGFIDADDEDPMIW